MQLIVRYSLLSGMYHVHCTWLRRFQDKARYSAESPPKKVFWEDLQISPLLTQRVFHRTIDATPFWTKCVVNPRRIYEQGVHHISKPIEDNYVANEVDWRIARVFHYRKCDDSYALMAPECSGVEEDKTMQKYGERLKSNFEITEAELNNFSTS